MATSHRHAEAVGKKSTNLIPLVDMYKETSSAPMPSIALPPPPPEPGREMVSLHKRAGTSSPVKKVAKRS